MGVSVCMFLMVTLGSLTTNMQHNLVGILTFTRLQKVGETEMNSTSLLKRDWFSCDETEFCLVSDSFIFRSNTVETEVL